MGAVIGEACAKGLNAILDADISVTLFTNAHTPSTADLYDHSNYTLASWTGSSPIVLTSWPGAADLTGEAYSEHAVISWTPGAGASGVVYGVILRDYTSGDLICGLLFAAPKAVIVGTPITATIKARLKDPSIA